MQSPKPLCHLNRKSCLSKPNIATPVYTKDLSREMFYWMIRFTTEFYEIANVFSDGNI